MDQWHRTSTNHHPRYFIYASIFFPFILFNATSMGLFNLASLPFLHRTLARLSLPRTIILCSHATGNYEVWFLNQRFSFFFYIRRKNSETCGSTICITETRWIHWWDWSLRMTDIWLLTDFIRCLLGTLRWSACNTIQKSLCRSNATIWSKMDASRFAPLLVNNLEPHIAVSDCCDTLIKFALSVHYWSRTCLCLFSLTTDKSRMPSWLNDDVSGFEYSAGICRACIWPL